MNRKRFGTESKLIASLAISKCTVRRDISIDRMQRRGWIKNVDGTLASDYFSGGADLRSHSATLLRPTCLSKDARMRRKEASC